MKKSRLVFYLAYYLFYLHFLIQSKDLLLVPFIILPLCILHKARQEGRAHEPTLLELAFGLIGALYILRAYTLILLITLPSILVYFLYSRDMVKSIVVGFYLWSTFSLLVYVLSLLNMPALLTAGTLMFTIPIVALYAKRTELKKSFSKINLEECMQVLAVLFMTTLLFQGVLTDKFIPRTLGNIIYTTSLKVYSYLSEYGIVNIWHPYLGGGAPIFTADSPLLYHDIGFMHAVLSQLGTTQPFILTFNAMIFNYLLLIAVSLLYLTKRLAPEEGAFSILFPLIFLTVNSFGHYFAYFGAVKALSVFPALIIVLAEVLSQKELSWLEISFLSSMALLHHFVSAVEVLILCAAAYLIKTVSSRSWRSVIETTTQKKNIAAFALGAALVFVYVLPALQYSQYITPKHTAYSLQGFFSELAVTLPKTLEQMSIFKRLLTDILSMNVIDGDMLPAILFYLSITYITVSFLSTKKLSSTTLTILISFIVLLIVHGVVTQLTVGQNMEFGRGVPVIWGIAATIVALEAYKQIPNSKKSIVFTAFAIFILYSSILTHNNIISWYSESFITEPYFSQIKQLINQTKLEGRWVTFGMWEGVDTLLPAVTRAQTSIEQFYQTQHTRTIIEKVRGGLMGEQSVYGNKTPEYLINQLINTGTRYIWFYICLPEGNEVALKLAPYVNIFASDETCNTFASIPDSYLAETVTVETTPSDEDNFYSQPESYETVWIINPTTGEIQPPPQPTVNLPRPLELERPTPSKIVVSGPLQPGDWVLVKEKYSPMWQATQEDKQLTIYKTNTGMLLMNSNSQKPINLEAQPTATQKTLSLLTILAITALWLHTTETKKIF